MMTFIAEFVATKFPGLVITPELLILQSSLVMKENLLIVQDVTERYLQEKGQENLPGDQKWTFSFLNELAFFAVHLSSGLPEKL